MRGTLTVKSRMMKNMVQTARPDGFDLMHNASQAYLIIFFLLLAAFAQVASAQSVNDAISIIRQDCAGYTSCYTSMAAWEADYGGINFGSCQRGDLVCAGKSAVARIEGTWSSPDTKQLIVSGWNTGPGNGIRIYCAPGARHSGIAGSGYRLANSSSRVLSIETAHVMVDGLEIASLNLANGSIVYIDAKAADNVTIANNLIHGTGAATSYGIANYCPGTARIYNNMIFNTASVGYTAAIGSYGGRNIIYSNTIGSTISGFGIRTGDPASSSLLKNNIVNSKGTCFYVVTAKGSDYNACNGPSSSGGPHDRTGQNFSFANMQAGDFHLSLNDRGAMGLGTNLMFDGELAISTDIDSETRKGAWDIGADEASSSGGSASLGPPRQLSATIVKSTNVTISWLPPEIQTGVTEYGIYRNGVMIDTTPATEYNDLLVAPMKAYKYQIVSRGSDGMVSPPSPSIQVNTSAPQDEEAPRILLLKIEKSGQEWVVTWTTDEESTSIVEYGTDRSYRSTEAGQGYATSHIVRFVNIANATYFFRARSSDRSGNEAVSGELNFTADRGPGRVFYVDSRSPAASDGNIGSAALPWMTIQHAADVAEPGDTVIVRPGNYSRTRIIRGGRPGYPIIFSGESPPDMSHVNFNEIFNPASPKQFPGNSNLNAVTRGFSVAPPLWNSRDPIGYIRIENFEVTATYKEDETFYGRGGIYIAGAENATTHNIEIVGNFMHDTNARPGYYNWIGIRGDNHRVRDVLVANNTLFRVQGTGITLMGRDWLVEGNDISHGLDTNTDTGIEVGGDSDAIRFFGTGHIIRGNFLHDTLDEEQSGSPHIDGFQVFSVYPDSQYASLILIEGNYVRNMGQMLMSEDSAEIQGTKNAVHHVTFRNNVFDKTRANAIISSIDYLVFVNNVVANAMYSPIFISDSQLTRHTTVANNIFYLSGSGPAYSLKNSDDSFVDYNMYYPDYGNWPPRSPDYDKNSIFGNDPLFRDPAAGDFSLSAASPAQDAGVRWIGFSVDKAGSARPQGAGWDIGAYEYAGSYRRADADRNSCIDIGELVTFISRWKISNMDVSLREIIEAIGLWKGGCQ